MRKKIEEQEEAKQAKRNKVVMTFDLLGRKVMTCLHNFFYDALIVLCFHDTVNQLTLKLTYLVFCP